MNSQQKTGDITTELQLVKEIQCRINKSMRFREIIERKRDEKSKLCSVNRRGIYPEPIGGDEFENLENGEEITKSKEMTDNEKRLAEIPTVDSPIRRM